jgi:NTP pyrophosphatase (non-canonical NTP hydrolase)
LETTMNMNEYQQLAKKTSIFPAGFTVIYPALGLVNEAGEVAGKVKKAIRDDYGEFKPERIKDLKAELGDVLWYLAILADDLGLTLEEVAAANIDKLRSRMERGTLGGSGDKR